MQSDLTTMRMTWAWMRARARLAAHAAKSEKGQSTLEYVIIAALISIAAVALLVYIIAKIDASKSRIQTQ